MDGAHRFRLLAIGVTIAAGALAGCAGLTGGASPSTGSTRRSTPSTVSRAQSTAPAAPAPRPGSPAAKLARAQRTHEYPGPRQHETAVSGAATPIQLLQTFATAYINWSAGSLAPTMRALEQVSVGQARSALALAASQTAQDDELRQGGIANAGVVEAIAPVLGHPDQYAVVTRELTTASNTTAYQGLRPAWHLALATVTQLQPGQWVLSSWQPEN